MKNSRFTRKIALLGATGLALLEASCTARTRLQQRLDRAVNYYTAGRYDEAEIEFKNVLQLNVDQPDALARLGRIYLDDGRVGQSMPFLLRARDVAPERADVHVTLATGFLAVGAAGEARREASLALDRDPGNAEAPVLMADSATADADIAAVQKRLLALPADVRDRAPVQVALGRLALRSRRMAEAEQFFKRAWQADPHFAPAAASLGVLAWGRRDLAAADSYFHHAYDLAPVRSALRLQYVQYKLQNGDAAGARRLLEEFTQRAPDYLPGWLWSAEVALTEKRLGDADRFVNSAYARDPQHPETLLLRARVALAQNNPDQAATDLERAVSLYPQFALGHYQLGITYARKGDQARARASFLRAAKLAPDFSPAALALAETYYRDGNMDAATTTLKALVARNASALPPRLLLARAYLAQGKAADALALCDELERQFPANAQTPYLRGTVLLALNRRADARDAFEEAAKRMPDSFEPLQRLVDLDLADQRFTAADARAALAGAAHPHSATPHLLRAKIAEMQGKPEAVDAALRAAIAAEPSSPTAYLLLARTAVKSGHYQQARTNLEALLAKDPRDREANMMLAVLYDVQKDYPAARTAYERVLAVDPNATVALNNLAYLYAERLSQFDRAYELASRAHALLPDDPRTTDTLGWVAYRQGHYAEALALLRDSTPKLETEPEAQWHLGCAAYMLGEEALARDALTRAAAAADFASRADAEQRLALLAIDPVHATGDERRRVEAYVHDHADDPVALCRIAAWRRLEKRLPDARTAIEAAVRLSPKNATALTEQARLADASGNLTAAIDLARQAHALSPGNDDATITLGRLAARSGDRRWAASLLTAAADRSADPDVLFDAAIASYSIGQVADAADRVRHVLEIAPAFDRAGDAKRFLALVTPADPTDATARAAIVAQSLHDDAGDVPALMASAALSESRGDLAAAQRAYEKALERFPEFAPAQKALTLVYAETGGNPAAAAALAARAREAFPRDPELAKAFGMLVYRQGDFGRAVVLLQESAAARDRDAELLYYLGMAQYQLKRRTESKQSLQKALELGLNPAQASEARRSLAALE